MALHEDILNKIVSTIEAESARFDGKIPATEKRIFDKVMELTKDLEVKNGKITNSVKNIQSIGQLLREVEKIVVTKEYSKDVGSMIKVFDEIETLQKSYFSSLAVDVGRKPLLAAIKKDSINYTVDKLTQAGIRAEFGEGLKNILSSSIRTGGSYADLTEQLREYVKGGRDAEGKPIPGRLQRYTRGAVTDALNGYAASYNETVSQDLGWKWRMYTGTLIETSRPWCVNMVKKKYVHESELDTVLTDNIDGVKICSEDIPCNKKTGLPSGMMKGTTPENVAQRRGGWGCGHQFGAVPDAVIPKNLRDKIKAATTEPKQKQVEEQVTDPAVPSSDFKEATTFPEFNQRLKDVGINDVAANKSLKLVDANHILEAIERIAKTQSINIRSLEIGGIKSQAAGMYSESQGKLWIDVNKIKKKVEFKTESFEDKKNKYIAVIDKYKTEYLGNSKYDQYKVTKAIAKMNIEVKNLQSKIDKNEVAKPWITANLFKTDRERIQAVVTHEIGHSMHFNIVGKRSWPGASWKMTEFVSDYSRTNHKEWFTEWYTYYKMAGPKGVPDVLLKIFKDNNL